MHGDGIYPCITMDAQRVRGSKFLRHIQEAYESIIRTKKFKAFQSQQDKKEDPKRLVLRNANKSFEQCEEELRPTYSYTLQGCGLTITMYSFSYIGLW